MIIIVDFTCMSLVEHGGTLRKGELQNEKLFGVDGGGGRFQREKDEEKACIMRVAPSTKNIYDNDYSEMILVYLLYITFSVSTWSQRNCRLN